jgi:hypothetical protein
VHQGKILNYFGMYIAGVTVEPLAVSLDGLSMADAQAVVGGAQVWISYNVV